MTGRTGAPTQRGRAGARTREAGTHEAGTHEAGTHEAGTHEAGMGGSA